MSLSLRPYRTAQTFIELQRLRFTGWRAARLEGRTLNPYASVDVGDRETIEIAPASYQRALANHLVKYTRDTSLVHTGRLLRARDRLKRRMLKQKELSHGVEMAKRRCPADGDGAVLGALMALALSVGIAVPLSWGFIQEFEWPFTFSVVACVGLSLIDAVISHLAGRMYSTLVLDEPDTPFGLTDKERASSKVMLGLALGSAIGLTTVFAVFRSGNGGSIWLWLMVGFAALLIASWSGFRAYPASRVLRLRRLEKRLARAERRVSRAYDALELIGRRMIAFVERMRQRLTDLNHRGGVAFIRSYRRHHSAESLPPTMPELVFMSEQRVLELLFRPQGEFDIHAALGADQRAADGALGWILPSTPATEPALQLDRSRKGRTQNLDDHRAA